MMEYKGYQATIEFDDDDEVYHSKVVDIRDFIVFEALTVEQLENEFHFSIDDYLAYCAEYGHIPDKPRSKVEVGV